MTKNTLPAWLEAMAASWDGCMHDAPGEMIDIGTSIRAAAAQCLHQIAEPAAYPPVDDDDFDAGSRLWRLIVAWEGLEDEEREVAAQAIDEHIQGLMRAYVDADRAQRAAPQAAPHICAGAPNICWASSEHLPGSSEHLAQAAPVECQSCGSVFEAESYLAGYTDGKGHCLNCPGIDHAAPKAAQAAVPVVNLDFSTLREIVDGLHSAWGEAQGYAYCPSSEPYLEARKRAMSMHAGALRYIESLESYGAPAHPAEGVPAAMTIAEERAAFDDFFRKRNRLHQDTDTTFRSDAAEPWKYWQARAALAATPAAPEAVHPDDAAVDALAVLMKAKLAKQRAKGYGGWDTDCTQQRLSDMLRNHVAKGDPVDVANFCAFLSARGEGIAAAPVVLPEPDFIRRHEDVCGDEVGPPTTYYNADTVRALLAQASAPAAPAADARQWLQPGDMQALERFAETTEDDQSYDIGKEAVKRLAHFGCVESHGFGRYGITAFGSYVLGDWARARELPFKTQADRDAEHRAAIAARAAQGGA